MLQKKMTRRFFLILSAMTAASCTLNLKKIGEHESKMGEKSQYHTVIIGAGLGGLTCGAFLARQGIPVTVIEQHNVPGGYATVFDRAEGKFTFDVSLHGTSLVSNQAATFLEDLGVTQQIKMIELPEVYRLITDKIDIAVPQKNPEKYIALLTQQYPEEAEGIKGFINEILAVNEEVSEYDKDSDFSKKYLKIIFPLRFRKMWNIRNKTLADMLADHIKSPEVKDVLASLWGYYGLPPSKLSAFYYANATGGYLRNGSYHIKGGSQALSQALAETIENGSGEIIYENRVEKILCNGDAVTGVKLTSGREILAKAVVSNASAIETFTRMVPDSLLPTEFSKTLKTYQPSLSSFTVWLGLNQEIKDKYPSFGYHMGSGRTIEENYQACLTGQIEKMSFSIAIYDNAYKGYSSPGTSTLAITCLCGFDPWKPFEKAYWAGDKEAYQKEKERWADILIYRAEKQLIKDLSKLIEVKEVGTPLTNWRYTGNTHGAIYGFAQNINNAYMNRIKNRTPLNGLYLASAWGFPGGGFQGVIRGGGLCFQKMMEDWGTRSPSALPFLPDPEG